MKKKTKNPAIIKIAIFTVITTFFWIGFEVYRAITTEPDPIVPPEITESLDPQLDLDTLSKLPQRIYLNEGEINDTVILSLEEVTITQTEEAQEEETVSEEEEIVSEEATSEGETANE